MSELSNKLATEIFDALYDEEDLKELEEKMVIRQALGYKLSTIAIIEGEIEEHLHKLHQDKAGLVELLKESVDIVDELNVGYNEDIKASNYLSKVSATLEKHKCD